MKAKIGIIGGSGLNKLDFQPIADAFPHETPHGKTSGPVVQGVMHDRPVVFISRHACGQPAHAVNYAANVWAMKNLGVTSLLSICAVGGLRVSQPPGGIVLVTNFIDEQRKGAETFFYDLIGHVSFARPVSKIFFKQILEALPHLGLGMGAYVAINGPQFATYEDSRYYSTVRNGAVIGMTALSEAKYAREAELSYACLCAVTDYDSYINEITNQPETSMALILETMKMNELRLLNAIDEIVETHPEEHVLDPEANLALDAAFPTHPKDWSPEHKKRLAPIISRFLP